MQNIKISVIVPIINVNENLRKTIETLKFQTYSNLEIICLDMSKDDNVEMLNAYISDDARIFIHKIEECTGLKAILKGVSLASGDYISIVNPEDWLFLTLYKTFINSLTLHNKLFDIYMYNVGIYKLGQSDLDYEKYYTIPMICGCKLSGDKLIRFVKFRQLFEIKHSLIGRIYRKSFWVRETASLGSLYNSEESLSLLLSLKAESIAINTEVLYRERVNQPVEKFDVFSVLESILKYKEILSDCNLLEQYKYAYFQHQYRTFYEYYNQCTLEDKNRYYILMQQSLRDTIGLNLRHDICIQLRGYKEIGEKLLFLSQCEFDKYLKHSYLKKN